MKTDMATESTYGSALEDSRLSELLSNKTGSGDRTPTQHYRKPEERPFLKSERSSTTILLGGLTHAHETLIQGSLGALGYNIHLLPVPDMDALQTGKEFCNNGQCNPTYFTSGSLIHFLKDLERQGLSRSEICKRYVFLTASSCGPCRFGMYETEYRHALRNAGFDGFRIILFEQTGGLTQSGMEAGIELNTDFFLAMLNASFIADILNLMLCQIRPYEINRGETDRVMEESLNYLNGEFRKFKPFELSGGMKLLLAPFPGLRGTLETLRTFANQLYGSFYTSRLKTVADRFNEIPMDRTRLKPMVKITGEFWAQTTEGDGNFHMFRFLENEGAQVIPEPIATWILYMTFLGRQYARDRLGLHSFRWTRPVSSLRKKLSVEIPLRILLLKLDLADYLLRREWKRYNDQTGSLAPPLRDQEEYRRLSDPFFNPRSEGGEGYMEVAKNIYYHKKGLSHMVLSLKPFGCLPSTQSDGVQASLLHHFPDMVYLPIETSGEGKINAYSRVQMALNEARGKAREEYDRVLEETGHTTEEIRSFMERNPDLMKPGYRFPRKEGVAGVAPSYMAHLARLMKR